MTFTLTRQQLYDLVWSEPMQRLGKQIGISDVAIAKHCRKLGIPVPERGYWNKLQAGKPTTKVALPQRDLVTLNRVTISGTLTPELRSRIDGEPGVAAGNESVEALAERLRQRLGQVSVPRNFQRVYPAIAALLQKDERLRQEYVSRPYSWNRPRFEAPFERRRLLFLNGLFLGFAKVGGQGWIRGADARELGIHMGERSVTFHLDSPSPGRAGARNSDASPTARDPLCLTIESGRYVLPDVTLSWRDEDGRKLEQQVTEIIVGMAIAGEHLNRQRQEQLVAWERKKREEEEREAQRRKAEEERRERERQAAIAKAKRDTLRQDAIAWREAANIRTYVDAVRQASAPSDQLQRWVDWALLEANELDPITAGRAMVSITEDQTDDDDNGDNHGGH